MAANLLDGNDSTATILRSRKDIGQEISKKYAGVFKVKFYRK
jgi:hypothetical protein